MNDSRPSYPSDVSDAQWALIEPVVTKWRADRAAAGIGLAGAKHQLRVIVNAILYVNRTGVQWPSASTACSGPRPAKPQAARSPSAPQAAGPEDRQRLIADCLAGARQRGLAARFDISLSSVKNVLRKAGARKYSQV
jgi:transposase